MKSVEEQKKEWIEQALRKPWLTSFDKCDKCGSVRHCFHSVRDLSATCVVCRADEIFYTPPKPKLDLDDFCRL